MQIKTIKKLRLLLIVGFILVPMTALFRFSLFITFGFITMFLITGLILSFGRCPNCGKIFSWKRYNRFFHYGNLFSSKCLKCGKRLKEESI